MNKAYLSIVVPCYNEELVIEETHRVLLSLTSQWHDENKISQYEIIYVDDGSKDSTLEILKKMARGNNFVKVLSFSRNFGHQAALTAGLHYASGDVVVTLDADLQDTPEIIEDMLNHYYHGCEIVYGVRKSRNSDSSFKKLTASFYYKFMKAMGVKLVYNHADFRLLSRKVVEEFKKLEEVNRFLRGLIPMLGFKECYVYYDRKDRFAGETKYPLNKMLAFAWEGITSFTFWPLRAASIVGVIVSFIALILLFWSLYIKLTGQALPGWASTVIPIYFLGGLELLFLGVVGEYVGKIYMEVKRRPIFIIKEKINV